MRLYSALTLTFANGPTQDRADELLAALDDFQPTAIEDTDDGLRAFFGSAETRDAALARLQSEVDLRCTAVDVSDEDWAARSQARITPIVVGTLTIAPPWTATRALRESAPGLVIVIQPSMGFGTGHHASTRLCLHWLQHTPLANRSVIDIGTGSGVLAIAASMLGAARVVAVDVDADALDNARENAELNDASTRIDFREHDFSSGMPETFDVILANLTGGLLSRSAAELATLAKRSATLIVSGIQVDEFAEVTKALNECGWQLKADSSEEGWAGAVLQRS